MRRRNFLVSAGTAAASTVVFGPGVARATQAGPRVKLGLIGCGGRGTWLANLFAKHGGYELYAGADYFEDRVRAFGAAHDIPSSRLFSGLSGYRRLLDGGVDAVAVESPPFFHPAQAAAAVDAGKHVYLAKPVAVDAPGCRAVSDAAARATRKGLSFRVDFQTRVHPIFVEALRRVHDGALGDLAFAEATYHAECPFEEHYDALRARPSDPEVRLRAWGLSRALSGDAITEQEIHTIDVASWVMRDRPPLFAVGTADLTARPKIGDCRDHFVVYYQYHGGLAVQFSGRQFKGHGTVEGIRNRVFGARGVLETEYGGQVLIRGEQFYRGGATTAIYEEGAVANIAAFHRMIAAGDASNGTVAPSVLSNLVTILGRKAADTKRAVAWSELENDGERLVPDLSGLRD